MEQLAMKTGTPPRIGDLDPTVKAIIETLLTARANAAKRAAANATKAAS